MKLIVLISQSEVIVILVIVRVSHHITSPTSGYKWSQVVTSGFMWLKVVLCGFMWLSGLCGYVVLCG